MQWVEGRVIENHHWTDTLFSLKVEAKVEPFIAGQFTRLALDIDGEQVARPYSYLNAPNEDYLEFYAITVPGGPLSNRLVALQPGDKIQVFAKGSGLLTLPEVPAGRQLWMLATGTALGPFLSILKMPEVWDRFERILLSHAVRHLAELSYREQIEALLAAHPDQLVYQPFVSREDTDVAIRGRIPEYIDNGTLEQCSGMALSAADSQVMICGNPDMVRDTTKSLEARGLTINKRRTPGNISIENYWK